MSRVHEDVLLSVAQAATLLGVHPNTIRAWTEAGRLTAYRINARGDRRYRQRDVARLLVEDTRPLEMASTAAPYGAFARMAEGLAASPTVGSVATAIVDGLRREAGLSRVAVYVGTGRELPLAAHDGFPRQPAPRRPSATAVTQLGDDLLLPIATPRTVVGALVVAGDEAAHLPDGFLDAFRHTAATVLAAADRLTRSRRELRRMRALRSITKELTGTLELRRVLADIIERTRTLFGADRAGIWTFDGTDHPVILASHGLSDAFVERAASLTLESDTLSMRAHRGRRAMWARHVDREDSVGVMGTAYADEGIRTVCIVPLLNRGRSIGVIGLYHETDRVWPEEEIDLAQAFAAQAAVAIQNARLYRSAADHAARLQSIQDLSARLNRLTDVQSIADAIVTEARTLAEYHDIRVYRVDWERRVCEPIAFTREMLVGDPAEAADLLRVGVGEGFTGWVAEHGEPLLINDALSDPRGMTIAGTDDVPESMLVVPMLYEGRALGVIVLSQLGFNRFTSDDLATMQIFAGYAAQAMANADTYERLAAKSAELERRAESQRRLLEINERLLTTLEPAGVFETIADGLRDVVAYDNLSIYRADHARGVLVPVLTREAHAEEVSRYVIPFGRGLMGWALEHGQPILANDALNDPRALQIPGTPADPEAVVVVPLMAEGAAIGALNVSREGGPEVYFSDSDFELIKLFAGQASIALRNADAHHATQQRADTDALTGLGNHGAFQRDLSAAIERASADPSARLSLLMMDLDNFKAYNDEHGHPAGDALLHRVATAIYGAVRADDRVYRYGGDEFALVLPDTTSSQAARVGGRVRRAVADLGATSGGRRPVTISVGVAELRADAGDRAGLIAAADAALYYGKRAGGDQVVRAGRLPDDVRRLQGTLEQLAAAAVRDTDEARVVAHLAQHASSLAEEHEAPTTARESERIGHLAAEVAERLGLPAADRAAVELGARMLELDDRTVARVAGLEPLHDASAVLLAHRSLLAAGARRGRRAARARGHRTAHVLAAALLYDRMLSGIGTERVDRETALNTLRGHPATLRADVLEALAEVVGGRADRGTRRRRRDDRETERGAA